MAFERRRLRATEMSFESLKEWAYLNPRTFVPKVEVLEKYGVKAKEGAREVGVVG